MMRNILIVCMNCSPKMVGPHPVENSTGQTQMIATLEMLDEWKVKEMVVGMGFDTTSSNSGIRLGCCSLMEIEL